MNVEDMLTLFFAVLAIVCFVTYLKWNIKYIIGRQRTENVFLRAVYLVVLSLTIILVVNSFGRVLEVMGYSSPEWYVSQIRRALYIAALAFSTYAGMLLCIVTKPNKE